MFEMNEEIKNEIQKLKKEKDAVILAHYYVDGEVQEIADYVGDSYYLAEIATKVPESTIIFCGVSFMGESAKILNPKKRVVMADGHADCPMAHMVDVDKKEKYKKKNQKKLSGNVIGTKPGSFLRVCRRQRDQNMSRISIFRRQDADHRLQDG